MTQNEMAKMLTEYKKLKQRQNTIDESIKAIENAIKAEMGDTEAAVVGGVKISYKKIIANRFDTTAFKAENAALYERYLKQSEQRRFAISF